MCVKLALRRRGLLLYGVAGCLRTRVCVHTCGFMYKGARARARYGCTPRVSYKTVDDEDDLCARIWKGFARCACCF